MSVVDVITGRSPVILAMPHSGLYVPDDIYERFNRYGRELTDTDWHIDQLYAGLLPDVTMIRANFHRYVIDPNRDPLGTSLYPGQNTTRLCPLTDFDANSIYRDGQAPNAGEVALRCETYHAPYHAAVEAEIMRVKALHGIAVLFDCHSIRSEVPFLFEGQLPDFNIGTYVGQSCSPDIQSVVAAICAKAKGYSFVENGRFKGGWTTRHYGRPDQNIHAIQMELAQHNYMQETSPWTFQEDKAEKVRGVLKPILQAIETTISKGAVT